LIARIGMKKISPFQFTRWLPADPGWFGQVPFFYLKKKFPGSPPDFSNIEQYRGHTICIQNQSVVIPPFARHKLDYDAIDSRKVPPVCPDKQAHNKRTAPAI
jgi:hypothetical protein